MNTISSIAVDANENVCFELAIKGENYTRSGLHIDVQLLDMLTSDDYMLVAHALDALRTLRAVPHVAAHYWFNQEG